MAEYAKPHKEFTLSVPLKSVQKNKRTMTNMGDRIGKPGVLFLKRLNVFDVKRKTVRKRRGKKQTESKHYPYMVDGLSVREKNLSTYVACIQKDGTTNFT